MFDPTRDRRQPLSTTPAAVRARRRRQRRRAGLLCFTLPLSVEKLERVVRAREGLPTNAPVTKQQIHRALAEGIEWWSSPWLTLRRVTRNDPR
jgi:hypothetical protein